MEDDKKNKKRNKKRKKQQQQVAAAAAAVVEAKTTGEEKGIALPEGDDTNTTTTNTFVAVGDNNHSQNGDTNNGAYLETTIAQFLSEKHFWDQKQASFEEKIINLEREKDSWILSERINLETIQHLNNDIKRLEVKVVDLELENQHLLEENASNANTHLERSMASSDQLTKLASENKGLNSEMEAASALVEKLITENAELVEKVNELFIELHGGHTTDGLSSANATDSTVALPLSESSELIISQSQSESMEDVPIKDDSFGEIVAIAVEDNVELQSVDKDSLPLSDAPLIGAPFRFISFVAHYVSGADLVDNS
ncbi:hypothetical protein ACFE04_002986 [Oxalis oulophora]